MRPAKVLSQRLLANETVLVDSHERKVFVLNRVGGVIWNGVERMIPRTEIVEELVKRFQVDTVKAAADVEQFFSELEGAGLIEPCTDDEAPVAGA